jgi:hypothetical protein
MARSSTTFQKGVSGNLRGRPRVPQLKDVVTLCRELTPQLVTIMFNHAQSENAAVSFRASAWLLERGWGRAPQPLELQEESGLVPQHFRSDLEHAMQERRERMWARDNGDDEEDEEDDGDEEIAEDADNGSPAAPGSPPEAPAPGRFSQSAGVRAVERPRRSRGR